MTIVIFCSYDGISLIPGSNLGQLVSFGTGTQVVLSSKIGLNFLRYEVQMFHKNCITW